MSTFNTSNHFDVSLDRFVQFSREPELLDYLSTASGLAKREVFGRVEDDENVSWKVSIAVDENIPAPLRKLVGSGQLKWTNAFVMNKKTMNMTFTIVDSMLEKMFGVRGEVTLHKDGPQATRMDLVVTLKSKVPLLGKSLEKFVADKVLEGWRKDATCRGDYMSRRMIELRDAGQLAPDEAARWAGASAPAP